MCCDGECSSSNPVQSRFLPAFLIGREKRACALIGGTETSVATVTTDCLCRGAHEVHNSMDAVEVTCMLNCVHF